jgi:hypothetical protein
VVFGSGAKESDTTDVNLFDGTGKGAVRLLSLQDERVQVADNQCDWRDLVGSEIGQVRVDLAGEDTWETKR